MRVSQPRSTAQVYSLARVCTMSCMIDEPRRRRDVDILERSYKIPTSTEPTYNLTDERLFPVAFTIEVAERTLGKPWIEPFSSQPRERSPYDPNFSDIASSTGDILANSIMPFLRKLRCWAMFVFKRVLLISAQRPP